ncbi:MAG TPA: PEP-CTERM sorting domain-containing protein [Kiritimatiellia bacterium]|nr:PEP-CTERM sorting domain-containing protein [Kiritimatiellia bacterium]
MKFKRFTLVLSCLLLIVLSGGIRADIIVDSANFQYVEVPFASYELALTSSSSQFANFYLSLNPSHEVNPEGWTLGIGHAYFELAFNTAFTPELALTAIPFADSLTATIGGPIDASINTSFYLGYWLDENNSSAPDFGDNFGWVLIERIGDELVLVDSAMETTGAGIYIGTFEAVPEPTTMSLLILSLGVITYYRRVRTTGAARN